MGWVEPLKSAGVIALSTVQLLASLLYTLSTPLRWPLYYISYFLYNATAFLLSPLWIPLKLGFGFVSFLVSMIARLEFLYIYVTYATIIGLCAGFVLYNTSSFFFVLLGLDTAEEQQKLVDQYYERQARQHRDPACDDQFELAPVSADRASGPGRMLSRSSKSKTNKNIGLNDTFVRRGKLVQTLECQPKIRREIGFMAQTIHEESSDSDSI